jgi:integrase
MTKVRLKYIDEYVDNSGKLRRYFRKGGKRLGMLPGAPGSSEFMDAYQAFLDAKPAPVIRQKPEGSFGKLVTDFYASSLFRNNTKESSRKLYRSILDKLAQEHGHRGVSLMTPEAVERIVNRVGNEHPAMGNLMRSVLRRLMKFAVKSKLIALNPAADLDGFKVGEIHSWTDAELRQFEAKWRLGTRERLAYALFLYTGQRGGDVVKMHRSDIVDGQMRVVQEKTGADLWVPIHPELARVMRSYPAKGLTLIGDATGRPIKRPALTAFMAKAIEEAGLPDRCVPHGLRKAAMRRLAEAGATEKQIAAISGHKTLREVQRYTKAADQRRLAVDAMAKLPNDNRPLGKNAKLSSKIK